MVLVTIFPANISQRPVLFYRHLVYEAYAQTLPFEATSGLGLLRGLTLQHETIFSSHDISLLRFLLGSLESHHHAIACYEIFMLGQSHDDSSTLWPCAAIGSSRVPRQGKEMTTSHNHVSISDDTFLVSLFKEQSPRIAPALTRQKQWLQVLHHGISPRHLLRGRGRGLVYGKGAEAQCVDLAKGVKRTNAAILGTLRLGRKERIIWSLIKCHPVLETCVIYVGGIDFYMRSRALPYFHQMGKRSRRWILARLAATTIHGGVHVKRYIIYFLSRQTELLHIFRVIISLELLLRI